MGADYVSNSIMIPTKKFVGVLKHELLKLEHGLPKAKTIEDLKALGICFEGAYQYYEEEASDDVTELVEAIKADIDLLKTVKKVGDILYRDMSWHEFTVNGTHVMCVFSGEMSWGDEPDGAGYQTLGKLCDLGIANALYKAIPWDARKKK